MRQRNHFARGPVLIAAAMLASACAEDGGGAAGGGAGGDPGEARDADNVRLADGAGGGAVADVGPPPGGAGGAGGQGGAPADAGLGGQTADAAPPLDAARPADALPIGETCGGHEIIDLTAWLVDHEGYDGTTDGASAGLAASCGGAAGGEVVFKYVLDRPLDRIIFRTDYPETQAPTVLYVRTDCEEPVDLACNRGAPGTPGTRTALDGPAPGTYYVVVDQGARDGGGPFRLGVELDGASACRDGDDNDGDGLSDLGDPGCAEPADESEADPDVVPACFDGLDNNENGLTDFPADPDCTAAGDDREGAACALDLPAVEVGQGGGLFPTNLIGGGADLAQARCFAELVPEALFILTLDRESNVQVINRSLQNRTLVTLFARTACDEPASEIACADPFTGQINLAAAPAGVYFVFAEASQQGGPPPPGGLEANIEFMIAPTHRACDDALDNDRDGAADLADPGCRDPRDDDEADPNVQPFCANGLDDDQDGNIDFPNDDGCTGAGDVCEGVGDDFCGGACVDVLANVAHCGRCDRSCDPGVACIEGRCGALRPLVLSCGNSSRDVQEFIRGDLVEAELVVQPGCVPDENTQALVVARGGVGDVQANAAGIRAWMEDGGQVLTEWNASDEIYNALFNAAIQPGMWNGGCQDNVQNAFQFTPDDPFWQDNEFIPVAGGATGCGYNIVADQIPDFVPLLGWDANNVSMGYVDASAGRLWLIEADWQDSEQAFSDNSRDLMAYMIGGGRHAPAGVACGNGRDDDMDGLVDLDDPGCAAGDGADEADPAAPPACANGVDDDRDGRTDWPGDPGCAAAGAAVEDAENGGDPPCANGLDDDADGLPDFPSDPGCQAPGDPDETDPARRPPCGNRRDDDGDALIDFPFDPGCAAGADPSEVDPDAPPACANGADDDRDGLIDFPADPGCFGAGDADNDETDPARPAACANRADDNGDGRIDFPFDPGCAFAADPNEDAPPPVTACTNGADDDGDGRTDFPDDPGCRNGADDDEANVGRVPPRCADGIDNDVDGLPDGTDVGCEGPLDDDEADPVDGVAPWCQNGADDDADGNIDWPADEGCAAAGDPCEEVDFIPCDGVCLDGQTDPSHCGACGNACAEGVECIAGFCGGLFYAPGIQQNVPEAGLNGWRICHQDGYDGNTPVANLLGACNGRYVALGCRPADDPNYTLLAMGEHDQVFFDTGDGNSDVHEHNGVNWYFSQSFSIGFVPVGELPARNSCDTNQGQPDLRMCWHTGGGNLNPGYRCGQNYPGDPSWQRVVLTAD